MDVTIPCPCPPKADGTARHDHDTVTIEDTLDFRTTLTIRQTIRFTEARFREAKEDLSLAELTAVMAEAYLVHCISGWSLVDDKGKPVIPTRAAIREWQAANYEAAEAVGDAADTLYSEKVVLPLLRGASSSSPSTPTPEPPASPRPTSATTNGSTPPKPSKRSSTTTSPMAVTGPMAASPGGVSSSSPN